MTYNPIADIVPGAMVARQPRRQPNRRREDRPLDPREVLRHGGIPPLARMPVQPKAGTANMPAGARGPVGSRGRREHIPLIRNGKLVVSSKPPVHNPTHPNNRTPHNQPREFSPTPPKVRGPKNAGNVSRGGSSDFSGDLDSVLRNALGSIINPGQYADSAANAEFGQPLSELRRQIASAPRETAQHTADIGSWYDQAGGQATKSALANQLAAEAAASSSGNVTKGIIEAMGGSANPGSSSVGSMGAIAASGILGQGRNESAFDQQMAALLQGEGAEQKVYEGRRGASLLSSLRGSLTDTLAKRGASRNEAFGKATGERFSQLGQLQNMILGQQLSGPELESARLSNVGKRQDIARNYILNQQEEAKLQDFKDTVGAGNTVGNLDADARASLSGDLTTHLLNNEDRLTLSPGRVRDIVAHRLFDVARYDRSDPEAKQLVDATVASLLTPERVQGYDKKNRTNYAPKYGYKPYNRDKKNKKK